MKPDVVVWRRDAFLLLEQQGVKILGVPVGQPGCGRHFLSLKSVEHETQVGNTQAVWLQLSGFGVSTQISPTVTRNITMHTFGNVSSGSSEVQAVLRQ